MYEQLIEEGKVVKIENSVAEIEITRSESCNDCTAKIICQSDSGLKTNRLKLEIPQGILINDRVKIIFGGNQLMWAAILLYGFPIIILVTTIYLIMQIISESGFKELIATVASIFTLAVYYWILQRFNKMSKSKKEISIKLERII